MEYFEFDISKILNVIMMNKEHLKDNVFHVSRYAKEYILYFVLRGKLSLEDNKNMVELVPGDIYIFNKGEYHKPVKKSECEYYYIHFSTDGIKKMILSEDECRKIYRNHEMQFKSVFTDTCYNDTKCILPKRMNILNSSLFKRFEYLFENNKLSYVTNNKLSIMKLNYVSLEMIMDLEKYYMIKQFESKNHSEYNVVRMIIDYIEKNYNTNFDSDDIKKEFLKNYDYLNRIFKKAMGMPIIKYRNYIRINVAKNKLVTTNSDLATISEEVGFSDEYYFSRVFKSFEGISPGTYQRIKVNERIL